MENADGRGKDTCGNLRFPRQLIQQMNPKRSPWVIIASLFYAGYFPFVPGTFASVLVLGVCLVFRQNHYAALSLAILSIPAGFICCGRAERLLGLKDPRQVVIDEVSGMSLSLAFLPANLKVMLFGFFVFRLFDTLKPYPIAAFEKRAGAAGIMNDDLMAAAYTIVVVQAVLRLVSFINS